MKADPFVDLMLAFVLSGCSVAGPTAAPLFEGLVADSAPVNVRPMATIISIPDAGAVDVPGTAKVETRDFTAWQSESLERFPASERNSPLNLDERNGPRFEFLTW
jgi:hypothetical protein